MVRKWQDAPRIVKPLVQICTDKESQERMEGMKKKFGQELQHPFPAVRKDQMISYGGNQSWARQKYVQKSGCGVISCTDLLIYLYRYRTGCRTELFSKVLSADSECCAIPLETYNRLADSLRRRYLPVIPRLGMNSLVLILGLNRYFIKYDIRLRASWCVSPKKMWRRMGEMLAADLPVIFAVGPNFPFIWRKHKLNFYKQRVDGSYAIACQTRAHFITVTAMDKEWVRISSWGKEYYINKYEYEDYVKKFSCPLVSNMVYIKRR